MPSCPFKVGDTVIYQPSYEGRSKIMMTDLEKLIPGGIYKVARIDDEAYIVPEGFEQSLPSGLYWTEFIARDTFDEG